MLSIRFEGKGTLEYCWNVEYGMGLDRGLHGHDLTNGMYSQRCCRNKFHEISFVSSSHVRFRSLSTCEV